jgi:hypothetical protein
VRPGGIALHKAEGKEPSEMNTYKVTITEMLQREVTVKARSCEEAEGMVEEDWHNEAYVLDASDFVVVDFRAEPLERKRAYER